MSQLVTDLDRKVVAIVQHDACRSLPDGQGVVVGLPYHFEALPQGPAGLDQGLLVMWALMHVCALQAAQIDRLERVVASLAAPVDMEIGGLEIFSLRAALQTEARARVEAERKLADDKAKAGGEQ